MQPKDAANACITAPFILSLVAVVINVEIKFPKCFYDRVLTGLKVGRNGKPAVSGSAPNHTATSVLSNTVPVCYIANTNKIACTIV